MTGRRGLEGIGLVRLRLALVEPWVTSLGVIAERDVILARATVGGVEGWGECVAQPEPTYSPEYTDGALDVLRRHLVPRLLAAGVERAEQVGPALAPVKGHPMAKAALELAVLDAQLRAEGRSLAAYLNEASAGTKASASTIPPAVPAGVAIGMSGSVPELVEEVGRRVGEGYRRVKLKVHPGWDEEPVRAVRDRFGPALLLQADANGSYSAAASPARALGPLDGYGLLLVEQPLADDDLLGHAALAAALRTPVCLDESITSTATAATALDLGACQVVNIKAGRVGGYLEAVRVHDLCRARRVPVWCGGMLETGVGRAANLALATLPSFSLPGDLSAAERFWAEDIVTEPAVLEPDGTIRVPAGPGTGVTLRDDLAGVTVWQEWLPAG